VLIISYNFVIGIKKFNVKIKNSDNYIKKNFKEKLGEMSLDSTN